jgi:hypothetical protein
MLGCILDTSSIRIKSPAGREVAVRVRVRVLVQVPEAAQVEAPVVVQEALKLISISTSPASNGRTYLLLLRHHRLPNCFCFYFYFSFFCACTALPEEDKYKTLQLEGENQRYIPLRYQQ